MEAPSQVVAFLMKKKNGIIAGGTGSGKTTSLLSQNILPRLCAGQSNRRQDQFVWNMACVTQDLKVVIKLKGSLNWGNFEVIPRLMHRENNFTTITEKPTAEGDQSDRIWSLDTVLLPYQGVQIWWFPNQIESQIT
jgi:hypothetical protein